MALPVIIIDSATGSDTTSSGAGPGDGTTSGSTLSGTTNASTDAAGTTVTLPAGTDLSNVLTTGAHVIFLVDATAGARNFSKITGSAGSGGATPTVTVADAFAINLTSKSWAIGGKRATLTGATSGLLLENNSGSGDAMPGWTMQMASGHTETATGRFVIRRSGDSSGGPITIQGIAGAAVLPVVTWSSNTNGFNPQGGHIIQDFEMRQSNASHGGTAIQIDAAGSIVRRMKISHATNFWAIGINLNTSGCSAIDCEVGYTSGIGISMAGQGNVVKHCYVHNGGSIGIDDNSGSQVGVMIDDNIVYSCASYGIRSLTDGNPNRSCSVSRNTIDSCGSDGIRWAQLTSTLTVHDVIENNILSNNAGYGINFVSGTAISAGFLIIRGNCTYNNTSGACNLAGVLVDDPAVNPGYVGAASGNFDVGQSLRAKGWPSGSNKKVGYYSATDSFQDPGAAQRPESTGTLPNSWSGGLRPRAFAPGMAR